MILGQIEVTAQVEQGGLFDRSTHAGGLHETVGEVGLAGASAARSGATDEHLPMLHQNKVLCSFCLKYYGTTFHFLEQALIESWTYERF